jgi:hypothetical protein
MGMFAESAIVDYFIVCRPRKTNFRFRLPQTNFCFPFLFAANFRFPFPHHPCLKTDIFSPSGEKQYLSFMHSVHFVFPHFAFILHFEFKLLPCLFSPLSFLFSSFSYSPLLFFPPNDIGQCFPK